jgi:aminoglycoside/choline kinase family phosphotransferase
MDAPAVDADSYASEVRLATSVTPFVAVARALRNQGLSAPEIKIADQTRGFLILEDFGDRVFSALSAQGTLKDEHYQAAVDVLVKLALMDFDGALAALEGDPYTLPVFDEPACLTEAQLVHHWFWPLIKGRDPPDAAVDEFEGILGSLYSIIETAPRCCALRDFHSPNLIWLDGRAAAARVGLIDFQDAVLAPVGYDLVSLLQDARIDVSAQREQKFKKIFADRLKQSDFAFEPGQFDTVYAVLGAQRNTKILGIFARLATRDGKSRYLRHIPRVSAYLERCLAHPALGDLKSWYDRHLPADVREAVS